MNPLLTPMVAHRFLATFLFHGMPSPLDIGFQQIGGLSRELQTTQHHEGGENCRNLYLADRIQHGTLTLQRGVMLITPLTLLFDQVLHGNTLKYVDVVILLLNAQGLPTTSWIVSQALPTRWQTDDFDATSNKVLINTLELRYQDLQMLGTTA